MVCDWSWIEFYMCALGFDRMRLTKESFGVEEEKWMSWMIVKFKAS